jgi:hypothetical protein
MLGRSAAQSSQPITWPRIILDIRAIASFVVFVQTNPPRLEKSSSLICSLCNYKMNGGTRVISEMTEAVCILGIGGRAPC